MFIESSESQASPQSHKAALVNNSDRRYLPRWEASNKISYRKENDIVYRDCLSKDINCTGACLRASEELPVHQNLKLTIQLAENIDPIQVQGRVVWQQGHDADYCVGIQFDRVSDKASELIFRYAFEFKHDDMMKNWFKGF